MTFAKTLSIGIIGAILGISSIAPASAAPRISIQPEASGLVQQVQYRDDRWHPRHGHDRRPPQRHADRPGYYHGYQGFRDRRPGYRRHSDGRWYPLAAFTAGALIGGALNH